MINNFINSFLTSAGSFAGLFCCLFIILEVFLPVVPLALLIAINMNIFGSVLGILISYIFTLIGSYLFYHLVNKYFFEFALKHYKDKKKLNKLINRFKRIKLENLTLIIAMPYSPAFLINILAAVSNMNFKKYITASVFGRLFAVTFWGIVGNNIFKALTDPFYLLIIIFMLLFGYVLSKVINKKYDLE